VPASQTTAVLSPLPAATRLPCASQLALNRFFSMPAGAPSNVLICLSVGANGRMSQVRTVLSCEFDRSVCESGETASEVTVSVWPASE